VIIGLLFISAFPLYGGGSALLESESSGLGLALVLANSVVVSIIGRMIQTITNPHNKFASDGYFYARLLEAILLAISGYLVYSTGAAGEGVNFYRIAMIGLGIGSIPLLIALMHAEMISTWLGRFGLLGYSFLISGILADIIGEADIGLMLMIPGALFELTFAIWLIVIGFDSDSKANENQTLPTNQSTN
jgi:hypothetical protein